MLSENFQLSEYAQHRLMKNSISVAKGYSIEKKNIAKDHNNSINLIKSLPMKTFNKAILIIVFIFVAQIHKAYSFADIISLTAASGNYSDETIIRFHEEATYHFDSDWDALKLSNGGNTPNFYSELNTKRYAINSIPENFEEFSVNLNLKAAFEGDYTITAKTINDTYDSTVIVILEDKLMHTSQTLEENVNYSFFCSPADSVNRFILHFQKASPKSKLITGVNSKIDENALEVSIQSDYAYISFNNSPSQSAVITLLTSDGKVIYNNENAPTDLTTEIQLNGNNTGSIYIVRAIVGKTIIMKKFYN